MKIESTPEIQKLIEDKHINGKYSMRMIAKLLGVHHGDVSCLLERMGVKRRSRKEQSAYIWKNHKHPYLGHKGERAYWAYGKKHSEEHKAKLSKRMAGANNPAWKGGRRRHSEGYMMVYMPGHPSADRHNTVLEHRIVMEEHLGRYLEKTEYVHHKNGDKTDNRKENLELMDMKSHARLHMNMRYGKGCANE